MSDNVLTNIVEFCKPAPDFWLDGNRCWDDVLPSLTDTVKWEVGGTSYEIETAFEGTESLTDKLKRLIFNEKYGGSA